MSSESHEVWLGGKQPSVVGVVFVGVVCVGMLILAFALHSVDSGDGWIQLLFGFLGLIWAAWLLVKSTVIADSAQRMFFVEREMFGTSISQQAIPFEDIDKVLVVHSVSVGHDYQGKVTQGLEVY